MDYKEILSIVIPFVVAALGALSPILISWLKSQKIVQKAHLEAIITAMIPQVIEWVDEWAEQLLKESGSKPSGGEKLNMAISMMKNEVPYLKMTKNLVSRIESQLKKNK